MATLNWIGKEAVVNHHRKVPVRLLECDRELSAGDPDAGNLLVKGHNLKALKALPPRRDKRLSTIRGHAGAVARMATCSLVSVAVYSD
jgi:hypothetical protein